MILAFLMKKLCVSDKLKNFPLCFKYIKFLFANYLEGASILLIKSLGFS